MTYAIPERIVITDTLPDVLNFLDINGTRYINSRVTSTQYARELPNTICKNGNWVPYPDPEEETAMRATHIESYDDLFRKTLDTVLGDLSTAQDLMEVASIGLDELGSPEQRYAALARVAAERVEKSQEALDTLWTKTMAFLRTLDRKEG